MRVTVGLAQMAPKLGDLRSNLESTWRWPIRRAPRAWTCWSSPNSR